MDFRLSDEQQMLAEMVGQMLAETCTGADLRRLLDGGEPRDAARWEQIVALGLPGTMAPETAGGSGLGAVEMALIATACGYAALPEPLVEHAGVAVPLLAAAGIDLGPALSGSTVAVGHPVNPFVADADTADALLLADRDAVHLVPREQVTLVHQPSIDPFRRLFRVEWAASPQTRIGVGALWQETLDRGALSAAAQLLGLAQRSVDLSVAYASDRQQFGKPIGSFQAVKHHLANAQVKIEFARPVILAAAAMPPSPLARARISHAKLAATAAAETATHAAVQVHGAMGYSWEVDVHFLLKRSLALAQAWGTPAFHRARVAEHVLSAPLGADRTFDAGQIEEIHREAA
ncbi:acyl-CoA dehydrogenase [Sphingomonas populi]|uniref:Acyl-CoA dehydrogenase n=1 Tax=Sphingomonas populi TaxID=2484750 RepID=A0A4Q6Y5L1_9SPHN|nr:acyl-CoA dehydrogenase family protein [Sphingomonas populi]RZF64739.1 acyl-CoA dehydrogenase [Sphingomonas populi]